MCRIVAGLAMVVAFVGVVLGPGPDGLEQLRKDAAAVRPLVKADCVRGFLDATVALPDPGSRIVYYQRDPKAAFTEEEEAKLPQEQRDKLRKIDFDAAKYYDTFYGSPLAYSRALDLCAAAGLDSYEGKRILDYGYGTVGHLRLLASCGAEATGVDVDPILRVLYGRAEDQGEIAPAKPGGKEGRVTLVDGFWPGTSSVREKAAGGMDLFISKNTLKNGYVHPPQGTDPRRALTLGVSDEEYVRALAQTVKPGGLVMIYNIGPAPAKEGEPFKTMADIRCPFSRELWAGAGFDVVAFERDDTAAVRVMAKALGWDQGEDAMDLEHDLFASYTLARRKP
jgi:SAM-dependent methyltransferase